MAHVNVTIQLDNPRGLVFWKKYFLLNNKKNIEIYPKLFFSFQWTLTPKTHFLSTLFTTTTHHKAKWFIKNLVASQFAITRQPQTNPRWTKNIFPLSHLSIDKVISPIPSLPFLFLLSRRRKKAIERKREWNI